jgi:hypothetical protein
MSDRIPQEMNYSAGSPRATPRCGRGREGLSRASGRDSHVVVKELSFTAESASDCFDCTGQLTEGQRVHLNLGAGVVDIDADQVACRV